MTKIKEYWAKFVVWFAGLWSGNPEYTLLAETLQVQIQNRCDDLKRYTQIEYKLKKGIEELLIKNQWLQAKVDRLEIETAYLNQSILAANEKNVADAEQYSLMLQGYLKAFTAHQEQIAQLTDLVNRLGQAIKDGIVPVGEIK